MQLQVVKVERVSQRKGELGRQVRWAITGLDERTTGRKLLEHLRGHWGMEDRLHYVREVTSGEDASQEGVITRAMGALAKTVIGLLHHAGWTDISEAYATTAGGRAKHSAYWESASAATKRPGASGMTVTEAGAVTAI